MAGESISYEEAMSKRRAKTVVKNKSVSKKAKSKPKRKIAMPETRSAVKQVGRDAKRAGRKVQAASKNLIDKDKTMKSIDKAIAREVKDPTGMKRLNQRVKGNANLISSKGNAGRRASSRSIPKK